MNRTYHIRLATPADVPHLPEIERRAARIFVDHGFSDDDILHVLSVEEHAEAQRIGQLWVAADLSDSPIAFIKVSLLDVGAHIDELDVDPDYHRQGIGAALIETVCSWAKSSGKGAVTLTTERDIPWNAPYYARLGFRIVPPGEQSPGLRAVFALEASHAPSAATRVAMMREL